MQAKLTWIQRTGAHLYFEFAADFVLYFVFLTLPLIFCSSGQSTALHGAARYGHTAVCELLIAGKADVDAKDGCAFMFLNLLLILSCIILMTATHPPACSGGNTSLKSAILLNKSDVVALLRSVGASQ